MMRFSFVMLSSLHLFFTALFRGLAFYPCREWNWCAAHVADSGLQRLSRTAPQLQNLDDWLWCRVKDAKDVKGDG